MSWLKIDDQMAFHHKILAAGDEAVGAWVRVGAWSCAHGTDGFVPKATALAVNRKPAVWATLLRVVLLDAAEGGYRIHDFLHWNPTAEKVSEKRARRSEAGRLGGLVSASKRQANGQAIASPVAQAIAAAKTNQSSTPSPSPSPSPSPKKEEDLRGDSVLTESGHPTCDPEGNPILTGEARLAKIREWDERTRKSAEERSEKLAVR